MKRIKLKKMISAAAAAALLAGIMPCAVTAAEPEVYDMTGKEPVLTVDAEDGDYRINVVTGGDTETNANVYINGGERVRAYTLEAGEEQDNEQFAVPKDGKITIEVKGDSPNVKEIRIEKLEEREAREHPAVYIAGDSTAQTYDWSKTYPQTGWGQVIGDYFTDSVTVENRSMGGRSSKSFDNDGRLDRILAEICPGDYLLIQFGINDGAVDKPERYISVEDYKTLLTDKYIGEARKRGAIPILLTATAASWWDEETGSFSESRQDYAVPTKEVAEETGVTLIDVNAIAENDYNTNMTPEEVFSMYFICEPLESAAYPEGTDDHTHLKEKGARQQALYIAKELAKTDGLSEYIVTDRAAKFTDIDGHWAESVIKENADKMNIKGISETSFAPDEVISRAEFLKLAMDETGICGHAYREGECLDASADDWYRFYLQGALDKGIIPAHMIEGCTGTETETKTVKEETEETEAVTADITVYTGGNMSFDGDKTITREDAAELLYAAAVSAGMAETAETDVGYTDSAEISEDAAAAVASLTAAGVFGGYEDGSFRPDGELTRAEAVKLVSSL